MLIIYLIFPVLILLLLWVPQAVIFGGIGGVIVGKWGFFIGMTAGFLIYIRNELTDKKYLAISNTPMTDLITDNTAQKRYELSVNGHVVFCDYRRDGNVVTLKHVEAPEVLRGTGAAGKFMQVLMEKMRDENLKVIPACSYAATWIERHKQFAPLVQA